MPRNPRMPSWHWRMDNESSIPTATLWELFHFTRPPRLGPVEMWVKDQEDCGFHGKVHWSLDPPLARLTIGPASGFPFYHSPDARQLRRGYIARGWVQSRIEAFVFLMAHELRHAWQANRGRLPGTLRKCETDADEWAVERLGAWRERRGGGEGRRNAGGWRTGGRLGLHR